MDGGWIGREEVAGVVREAQLTGWTWRWVDKQMIVINRLANGIEP